LDGRGCLVGGWGGQRGNCQNGQYAAHHHMNHLKKSSTGGFHTEINREYFSRPARNLQIKNDLSPAERKGISLKMPENIEKP
jgi:hypothetical protein